MFVAILAVFIAGQYQPWMTKGDALLLGVAVAVLAPIGDLFESMVKRDAGTKDTGTMFGPHGGALDRLDAIIFTIVAGYYVWVGVSTDAKRVVILGSTGSIGVQALDVVARRPRASSRSSASAPGPITRR